MISKQNHSFLLYYFYVFVIYKCAISVFIKAVDTASPKVLVHNEMTITKDI